MLGRQRSQGRHRLFYVRPSEAGQGSRIKFRRATNFAALEFNQEQATEVNITGEPSVGGRFANHGPPNGSPVPDGRPQSSPSGWRYLSKRICVVKIVLQRVSEASVRVDDEIVGQIGHGLLILVGVGHDDGETEAKWLADKAAQLRIFNDEDGKMNRSLIDVGGEALVVSQFTLLGDCRKGRRPAFTDAGDPVKANQLYLRFAELLAEHKVPVQRGVFAADMKVSLVNDGPVTMILERP